MKENKDEPRKVSTCFEGSPCAEMMEKIIGEEGIGSLCEEMMRVLGKGYGQGRQEPVEAQKEEAPEKDRSGKIPRRPRQGQKTNKEGVRK